MTSRIFPNAKKQSTESRHTRPVTQRERTVPYPLLFHPLARYQVRPTSKTFTAQSHKILRAFFFCSVRSQQVWSSSTDCSGAGLTSGAGGQKCTRGVEGARTAYSNTKCSNQPTNHEPIELGGDLLLVGAALEATLKNRTQPLYCFLFRIERDEKLKMKLEPLSNDGLSAQKRPASETTAIAPCLLTCLPPDQLSNCITRP